ncbi:MAG TPA: outer membrane protein assembly factor BamE [Verrucomicrobiae bacterium]|nr:outer membrane protein assembly factor BamE [Verrucomicrobiae bacterium]
MNRISKFIIGGVLLLLWLPIFSFTYYLGVQRYTPIDSFYTVLLGTDTAWAKDYRESNFARVKVGMTHQEVRKIMGDPVTHPNPDHADIYWSYTWSPRGTHYHQRGFLFSPSGSVTQVVKGFYFD